MGVQVSKPELEKFVDELVKSGHFASPAEVVEAGLARLMLDPVPDDLDPETAYDVRITKQASSDSLAIYRYIEQDSPQNAADMADRLLREIDALEFLPTGTRSTANIATPIG